MKQLFRAIAIAIFLFGVIISKSSFSQMVAENYIWKPVPIGGGGYVTGIIAHPSEKNLYYIRTDIGGAYRWETDKNQWVQMLDWLSPQEINFKGVDGMAIAPSNPNILYLAAGQNHDQYPSDVLKSTDRGKTWKRTFLNKQFRGNASMTRYAGECLAIDPNNENIVFCGTRYEGLWKTTDGGENWQRINEIPSDPESDGVRSILFKDSRTIYVGLFSHWVRGDQSGVYRSNDGGQTWQKLNDFLIEPMRLALGTNNVLYVSSKKGVFSFDGKWKNISPEGLSIEFSGIAVNPQNGNHVVCSERKARGGLDDSMYQTFDGGTTWQRVEVVKNFEVPWWSKDHFNAATASIMFDPHVPNKVWFCDWYGVWFTPDITKNPSAWHSRVRGFEEAVVMALTSFPKGAPLMHGNMDSDAMMHYDINEYPEKNINVPGLVVTTTIDFAEKFPNFIVRAGGDHSGPKGGGGFSNDYGKTWQEFNSYPYEGARDGILAVSSDGKTILWDLNDKGLFRSSDKTMSWEKIELPILESDFNGSAIRTKALLSDRMNEKWFYLIKNNITYQSFDGGESWKKASVITGQQVKKALTMFTHKKEL